jgi:hypothetical protein
MTGWSPARQRPVVTTRTGQPVEPRNLRVLRSASPWINGSQIGSRKPLTNLINCSYQSR